ncbi:hypothetical protein [Bacteroides faecalis]|uniref:Uncharacterized protein n=1 Tax=Bacteroides faecalis TaxID=2447885 RepID=A0A401LSQ6_9BACE|nr:hypothetical protein [Bacteroides faecalis]GCB34437.1 hypothetical protein KGMB02408_13820 [Bacteroides faecalis]
MNGVIGRASEPNFFTPLIWIGKTVGTGVLAGIGRDFITKNTIDKEQGTNKLGINSYIFL